MTFSFCPGHHLFTKYITTNVSCGSIPLITNCCESEPLTSQPDGEKCELEEHTWAANGSFSCSDQDVRWYNYNRWPKTTFNQRNTCILLSSHRFDYLFKFVRNNSLLMQLFRHRYFQTILYVLTSCSFRICNIFFQWLCLFNPHLKRKSEARWQVFSLTSDLI